MDGVRDALLDREELIGDEIEALMAELGEREPIAVVPVVAASGRSDPGAPVPLGPAAGNGQRDGSSRELPPRPDRP